MNHLEVTDTTLNLITIIASVTGLTVDEVIYDAILDYIDAMEPEEAVEVYKKIKSEKQHGEK